MLRRTHGSGNTNCLSHRHTNTHDTIGSVSSVSTRYASSRHQKPFQAQREKTTIRQIVWFAILDGRFRLSGSVRIMYIDNEQCLCTTTSENGSLLPSHRHRSHSRPSPCGFRALRLLYRFRSLYNFRNPANFLSRIESGGVSVA